MARKPLQVDLGLQGGGAHGGFTWGVLDRLLEETWLRFELLASACLPTMFQAVEIDGEAYWDGGYAGNPTMAPLVRECGSRDAILVQINPIERPGTPRTAALLKRVVDPGKGEGAVWAEMRVHRIASDIMVQLGYSSKLIAEWEFLCMLRDEGRRSASAFLEAHAADLGVRSSLNLEAFLEGV